MYVLQRLSAAKSDTNSEKGQITKMSSKVNNKKKKKHEFETCVISDIIFKMS